MPVPRIPRIAHLLLAIVFVCTTNPAPATILRVPTDFPGVQSAMDACQSGDTVLVDRGVWTGLLESPTHTLLLCSNYLFTQDSTDIVETVLDGEYEGTILTVNTAGENLLSVSGFTFWRGQGIQTGSSGYCDRAGAVQMENNSNGDFSDIVFADCRAPRSVSVLFMGTNCSALSSRGSLTLRRIHCRGNTITEPGTWMTDGIVILARESSVIVDGFYWDGGGESTGVMDMNPAQMDTLALSNVRIVNCVNSSFSWEGGLPTRTGSIVRNIYSDGCRLNLRMDVLGIDSSQAIIRNIEVTGLDSITSLYVTSNVTRLDMDSIRVHSNRMHYYGHMVSIQLQDDRGHVLRNLEFHHNVRGDSTAVFTGGPNPHALIGLEYCSVESAYIHDNRVILPGDPNVEITPGSQTINGGILYANYGNLHIENVTFENNSVDDFDVYSNPSPENTPNSNLGRELWAAGDTLIVRNLTVRNSRMDNPVPEVITSDGLGYAGPGFTILLSAPSVEAKGILMENCDDGGILADGNLLIEGAILRDVKRTAIGIGGFSGYKRLRNVHVENTVGGPNWLLPQFQHDSKQAFLWAFGGGLNLTPTIDLENVTVTGSTNIRHLFSIWNPATLIVRNSVFHNNSYDQMLQLDTPTPQTWEYNIVEEPVPGIGNQVGIDPWFDPELGAPWLSPISPAIDAGHPDLVYNDIEDPDNTGFALWPSQGSLRNDIGFTGGPYAGTLEHLVAVRPPVTDRPAALPQGFTLHPSYPNPFNPTTTVSYTLARSMQVELSVYNLLGQQVRTLAFGLQDAGGHSAPFTAGELASGVYVVELKAGTRSQTRKVLLLK